MSANDPIWVDPGEIIILFDRRSAGPHPEFNAPELPWRTAYYLSTLQKLGWPSFTTPDLERGKIRLVWYTHAGTEGHRDYFLHQAYTVLEMLDSLSDGGFRPMILGWSGENPYPMLGGTEPPRPPPNARDIDPLTGQKKKVATSASLRFSGHGGKPGQTPMDRINKIFEAQDEQEAGERKEQVETANKAGQLAV
ncbi:hypothetical protein K470DRAFT_254089 [Piedraia hortae CBS 480.64]|uniref:Uncharacterized protein n=1 Tax=Piedraia hortae CBS 480.64 TaxID=1314780 RepID=A0A6A7CDK9_9PEZI|nr:hypothetical protein K470DRAFT_254089 [Piedraia hortae CBS 480.64]